MRAFPALAVFLLVVLITMLACVAVTPWLRRVHSVTLEDGFVWVETSPDGRLASPYRSHLRIPLSTVAIFGSAILLALLLLSAVVFGWVRHDNSQRPNANHNGK